MGGGKWKTRRKRQEQGLTEERRNEAGADLSICETSIEAGRDRGVIEGTIRNVGPTWEDGKGEVHQVPGAQGRELRMA